MDVSPRMVFSVATSMIPFLQNDDANRALMGSNMQRQAVPLMLTEAPVVGTGMEDKAAYDSGVCVVAKHAGVVERSSSKLIIVKCDDGTRDEYRLTNSQEATRATATTRDQSFSRMSVLRLDRFLQMVRPQRMVRLHLERTR